MMAKKKVIPDVMHPVFFAQNSAMQLIDACISYTAFNYIQEAVLILDLQMQEVFSNEKFNDSLKLKLIDSSGKLKNICAEDQIKLIKKLKKIKVYYLSNEAFSFRLYDEALARHIIVNSQISYLQAKKHFLITFFVSSNNDQRQQGTEQLSGHYSQILDASADFIKIIDLNGHLIYINQAGCEALLGPINTSYLGINWIDVLPSEIRQIAYRAFTKSKKGQHARFAAKTGQGKEEQYWDNLLTPIFDDTGKLLHILCVSRNVTSLKKAEKKLSHINFTDDLTGLPNRRALHEHLKKIIAKAGRKKESIGLLLVNLDQFKHINDTLGHSAGDHLLKVLSKRLVDCLDNNAFIARIDGDEFAIALPHLQDIKQLMQSAEIIQQQIEKPVTYMGKYINGAMSVGCAIYPLHAKNQNKLLQCADMALSDLKEGGGGGVRIFDTIILNNIENKVNQLVRSRKILRDNLIVAYYQPKVNLHDGSVVGYEALLRWIDESGHVQYPKHIEESFAQYELATKIGQAMQDKIFNDLSQWIKAGYTVVPISLNAAPVEFLRDDYAENFINKVEKYAIPPELIQIEITEHIFVERGANYVLRAIQVLKQYGIKIALDDFGTGHSSITHLRDYPVDYLKLDASYVKSICQDNKNLAIVKAITQLAPSFALDVVAEGVETEEQRAALLKAGCSYGQGFLFSSALSHTEVTAQLQLCVKSEC